MINNSLKFYTESGVAPKRNLFLIIGIGSVIMNLLSYFYSLIMVYMPLIYFNFILVPIYGYLVSIISYQLNRWFKIRNRKKSIITTIILSVLALYFQWVSYFYIISNHEVNLSVNSTYFFQILLRPDLVIKNIILLNKTGTWNLFGAVINGLPLAIVWLGEAAIIIITAYIGYKNNDIEPFSEQQNKWYKKRYLDKDFEPIVLKKKFIEKFLESPTEAINSLKHGFGNRYSRIYIHSLKSENKNLISIENILISQAGKGKKEVTKIIEPCYIDNHNLKKIKETYSLKKPNFLDFINDMYQQ